MILTPDNTSNGVGATATASSSAGLLDDVTIINPGSDFAIGDIVEVQEDGGPGIGHFTVTALI